MLTMTETVLHARLLGGWLDVADDVRRLERGLVALPDTCACGHGSVHLAGGCPCCRTRAHEDLTCTARQVSVFVIRAGDATPALDGSASLLR